MASRQITRRGFLKATGFCAAAWGLRAASVFAQPAGARPNVVFILADDLGYGDPACYSGQTKVPTPAMDRLASQGIRFTDAHTPSAVCTPTRYGILTGRYCWRSSLKKGVLNGYSEPLIEKFDYRANGPWRGQKADIHEAGHRVPFLCRWPGRIRPGTQSNQTICLTDLLATCAAVVGDTLPRDAGPDSCNILPAILDPELREPIREATIHHSINGLFAIRQGPWKLIQGLGSGGFTAPQQVEPEPGGPKGQLYNLQDDPGEQKNLWLDQPEIVQRLTTLLERYKEQGYSRPM